MSRHKSFCSKCSAWTMHTYEYERYPKGVNVIMTCEKCGHGHSVEEFKGYDE